MKFQGTITRIMPQTKVNTTKGETLLQTFELTYEQGQYPRRIAFEVFGTEKIKEFNIQLNEQLTCHIDFDTREYKGRVFNSVRCWKVDHNQQQNTDPQQQDYAQQQPQTQETEQHQIRGDFFCQKQHSALQQNLSNMPLPEPQHTDDLPF